MAGADGKHMSMGRFDFRDDSSMLLEGPLRAPLPLSFFPHTHSLSLSFSFSLSHTLFGLTLHLHGCCQRALSLALQSVDLASWRWTVAIFPSGFIWDWSWLYRDFYRKTERGGDRDNMRKRNSVFANVLF